MLSVQTRGKILVLKLTGELHSEHIDEIEDLVEEKIDEIRQEQEKALVLLDLRQYDGAHDISTAWKELRLVTHYADLVDKIAVVGLLDWQKLATHLVSPFTRAHERFFEPDEVDEATEWLLA